MPKATRRDTAAAAGVAAVKSEKAKAGKSVVARGSKRGRQSAKPGKSENSAAGSKKRAKESGTVEEGAGKTIEAELADFRREITKLRHQFNSDKAQLENDHKKALSDKDAGLQQQIFEATLTEQRLAQESKQALANNEKIMSEKVSALRTELDKNRSEKKERTDEIADLQIQVNQLSQDVKLEQRKVDARYRVYQFHKHKGLDTVDDDADKVRAFITRELAQLVGQQKVKDAVWAFYNKLVIRRIKQKHVQSMLQTQKPNPPAASYSPSASSSSSAAASGAAADQGRDEKTVPPSDGKKAGKSDKSDKSSDDESGTDDEEKGGDGGGSGVDDFCGHFLLLGPPGTGKTTTAQIIHKILHKLGLVNDRFKSVMGTDMIDQYVGWTARKVDDLFKAAKGGVLFIDEVYSLMNSKDNFGREALDTLMGHLLPSNPKKKPSVVVMMAGYEDRMNELMSLNDGLQRRIGERLQFATYNADELSEMFTRRLSAKHDTFVADPESGQKDADGSYALRCIKHALGHIIPAACEKENAALIKRLYDSAEGFRAARLAPQVEYVSKDPALTCQFVLQDLVRAAESVNSHYTNSAHSS